MAKDKLTDYDSLASNNLDVGGISIAEGMLPSNVNNALREQMSHLADFAAGTSGVDVLKLQDDTDTNSIKIQAPASVTTTTTFTLPDGDGSANQSLVTNGSGTLSFSTRLANVVEDSTPQLGGNLDVNGNDITGTGDINITGTVTAQLLDLGTNNPRIRFDDSDTSNNGEITLDNTALRIEADEDNAVASSKISFRVDGSEQAFINSSGLDITGTVTADGLTVQNTAASNAQIVIENTSAATSTDYKIVAGKVGVSNEGFSIYDSANATTAYYIDSTGNHEFLGGNVGIGTDSPSSLLHLSTSDPRIRITDTDTAGTFELRNTSNVAYISNLANASMIFATNSTEAMRITSGGNVGIGTTTPTQPLSLYANDTTDTQLIIEQDSTGDAGIQFSLTGIKNWTVGVDNSDGDKFKIENGNTIGGSNDFVIDSSGNVGIGANSPTHELTVSAANDSGIRIDAEGNNVALMLTDETTSNGFRLNYNAPSDVLTLDTTNGTGAKVAERMRIDSSGNLLVGTTTTYGQITSLSDGTKFQYASHNTDASGVSQLSFRFMRNSADVGSITTTSSATAYNTSSDYRLKENVVDMTGATERLKQLNPVRFNFIADADTTVDGFLAHEVADVVPEAITGTKDAMRDEEYEVTPAVEATYDDEGNVLTEAVPAVMGTRSVPDYQGIDQSKLVPLLTAALQEALTKIDDLEARIAALEAN